MAFTRNNLDKNFNLQFIEHDKELLFNKVELGILQDVKTLVSRGCDINQSDFKGVTPLMVAVKAGHTDVVKYLCEQFVEVNKATNNGETALYMACDSVNGDMVEILLDAGSDVNVKTNDLHPQTGRTPLMKALPSLYEIHFKNRKKSEAVDIVKMLLARGCDVDACDWNGNTALHLAADQNDLHTVCLVAENGANLHIRNKYGFTAFEESIQPNKQRYSVAIVLLLYGYDIEHALTEPHPVVSVLEASVHEESKYFRASHILRKRLLSLLFKTIHLTFDLEGKVKNFLKSCPNMNSDEELCLRRRLATKRPTTLQNSCRLTIRKALKKSMFKGIRQLPVARSLKSFLALNLDIDRTEPLKILELNTAVIEEDIQRVREMLTNNQLDVNVSFSEHTPLTEAARTGNLELCKILLGSGAAVNLPNNVGMNALHVAAEIGYYWIVEELLNQEADANKTDISEENALIKSASNGHFITMILLLKHGCSASVPNSEGIYAIHLAAGSGNLVATEALIEHGVSPEIRDRNLNTALHVAASGGMLYARLCERLSASRSGNHHDVINFLLRAGADRTALNKDNMTPLDIAVGYCQGGIVSLLGVQ